MFKYILMFFIWLLIAFYTANTDIETFSEGEYSHVTTN
jgi:hypothetical protein